MKTFHTFLLESPKQTWNSIDGIRKIEGTMDRNGTLYYKVSTNGRSQHELISSKDIDKDIERDEKRAMSRQQAATANTPTAVSLDGFERELSPMMRGKAIEALSKQVQYNGKFYPILDLIRMLVKNGYRVNSSRRLAGPDGRYLDAKVLTKIGIDFADFLSR